MTLENQIKDWKELKELCVNISNLSHGEVRNNTIKELYAGVKQYSQNYKTKFDMINKPR